MRACRYCAMLWTSLEKRSTAISLQQHCKSTRCPVKSMLIERVRTPDRAAREPRSAARVEYPSPPFGVVEQDVSCLHVVPSH